MTKGKQQPKQSTRLDSQKGDLFTALCKAQLKTECVKEYRFHPTRRWRFDYAIPNYKIAIEVEGGIWTQGRHTRPKGFLKDIEKYNSAALLGWKLFRTTPKKLCTSDTIKLLKEATKENP